MVFNTLLSCKVSYIINRFKHGGLITEGTNADSELQATE